MKIGFFYILKLKNGFQRFQQRLYFQQCSINKGLKGINKSNKAVKMLDGVGSCWTVLDCWKVGRPFFNILWRKKFL